MNHCVPVVEFIPDPSVFGACYLVMPLLRPFNDPEFAVIGEVVEFIQQVLDVRDPSFFHTATELSMQGLQFMHKHGVAHRSARVLHDFDQVK